MRKQHYGWWPYVRYMIQRYPERMGRRLRRQELSEIEQREYDAVVSAVEQTGKMQDASKRLSVIERVLMHHTHTISGAAILVPCSDEMAKEWCNDFIELVAKNFSCNGLI